MSFTPGTPMPKLIYAYEGDLEKAVAKARAEERERCAQVAESEEEATGDMPPELYLVPIEDAIRAAIRATKKSIVRSILELKDEPDA
jgi:hypothetical protein